MYIFTRVDKNKLSLGNIYLIFYDLNEKKVKFDIKYKKLYFHLLQFVDIYV
jgi:hypothetical protein